MEHPLGNKKKLTSINNNIYRDACMNVIRAFDSTIKPSVIFDYGLACYLQKIHATGNLQPEVLAAESKRLNVKVGRPKS